MSDDDKKPIRLVPAAEQKADELARLVKNLQEQLPAQLELIVWQAKVTRARFQALVGEGFTEAQAIQLCSEGMKS